VREAGFALERSLWDDGVVVCVGADECGRGSWAGPVSVGVCAVWAELEPSAPVLADSKLVPPKRRAAMAEAVRAWAPVATGMAEAHEIDAIGMAAALRLAASRALETLTVELDRRGLRIGAVIQDGSASWLPELPSDVRTIVQVRADATVACVAAASLHAKEERDALMRVRGEALGQWPAIAASAGYGTKAHAEQIRQHGLSTEHRRSWSYVERLLGGADDLFA
jgi:ribonuclease HII